MPPAGGSNVDEVTKHSVHTLVFRSQKRAHEMFISDQGALPDTDKTSEDYLKKLKAKSTYGNLVGIVEREKARRLAYENRPEAITSGETSTQNENENSTALALTTNSASAGSASAASGGIGSGNGQLMQLSGGNQVQTRKAMSMNMPKPTWHAPWKLYRVISGHTGWVRSVAVEPGNEWFATGAADRMIKIWDLASGKLKLSLTGHVSTVRGLVVSPR
jgi:pleiotropic regulator 1